MDDDIREIVQREARKILRKRQEEIFDEIVRIYDFAYNILRALDVQKEKKEIKIKIASPVVKQLRETADILKENYKKYLIHEGNPDKKAIKNIESSIRDMFYEVSVFISAVKRDSRIIIGKNEEFGEGCINMLEVVNNMVLPTQEELTFGKIRSTMEYLIKSRIGYSKILRACEQAFTHVFRITYRLAMIDIGLVSDPKMVIWGRSQNEPVYNSMNALPR